MTAVIRLFPFFTFFSIFFLRSSDLASLINLHGLIFVFFCLIWIGWPANKYRLDLGLKIFIYFIPDFLCIPLWGQSCGRQLYDDEGVIAARPSKQWRCPGPLLDQ